MKMRALILVATAVALLGLVGIAGAELRLPEIAAGKLNPLDEGAPAVTLPETSSGQPATFPGMAKGKVAVITFMQTSCSSCKQLMDRLQQLAANRPEVAVVAVAIDLGGPEVVNKYAKYFGFGGITFLADPQMTAARSYGISFTPGTFLADREGRLKGFMAGYDQAAYQDLERMVETLAAK